MKTIPNELLMTVAPDLARHVKGGTVYVKDMILTALDQPPHGGFNRASIKARGRVEEALSKADSGCEIHFEDQDYETAKACIDAAGWVSRGPHVVRLFDLFP